jgi:uncharacterized cupredoxin-like copper-binding protein
LERSLRLPRRRSIAVTVQLSSFKFEPKTIVLDHGRRYLLRLHNASDDGHDFSSPSFFSAAAIAPQDRRLVQEGEVEVPPGQVREVSLTAPGPGRYKVKCTHTMHKFFGMSGTILVR